MHNQTITINVLDPHRVNEIEKQALNTFDNRMLQEQWPGDSLRTVDETLAYWRFVPRYLDLHQWVACVEPDNRVVARASLYIGRYDENQHMADFDIYVVPEKRRQGIAKRLIAMIAETANREDRQLLLVSTDAAIPAGRAFVERMRARMGVASRTYQLDLANLNLSLVDQWCQRGRRQMRAFALGSWEGPYPSEDAESMARMKEVMNTTPRDNLELEAFGWTVEQLRQEERELARLGMTRWTMFLRHLASGEIAGFTEALWHPNHPEMLIQGNTAVAPRYRNRGLAQWLKGEMLRTIIDTRPEVERIRTDVANANASMRRINQRLGFKPCKRWTTWQIDLDQIVTYLGAGEHHGG